MKNNQKGFGAVEGLLILIIVILIGFIGWSIYHTDHKTTPAAAKTTASTNKPASSTSATSEPAITYYTIPQWGVRAPYSGNLSLEYTITTSSGLTGANFSSAQLDTSDPNCEPSGSYGGSYGGTVLRYASTDIVQNGDGTSSGQTPEQYLAAGGFGGTNGGNYSIVGNYYYFYVSAQAVCGSSQSSQNIETQTEDAVKAIVQNLKAVPSS